MQQAAQSQAQAMRSARATGNTPGMNPADPGQNPSPDSLAGSGGGASIVGDQRGYGLNNGTNAAGAWGKLPPRVAKGMMDAKREGVASEYREQVEAYFKAVADKARADAAKGASK